MEDANMWDDTAEVDLAEDKIDGMSAWELGFERGVAQAEEELFEDHDE